MTQVNLTEGPAMVTAYSLPMAMVKEVRRRAKKEDRPFSWVVRRALEAYLAGGANGQEVQQSDGK